MLSVIVPDICWSTSGFRGYIAISGRGPLLQRLAATCFEPSVVVSPRYAVGILIEFLYFQRYKYFRFWQPFSSCRSLLELPRDTFSSSPWSENSGLPLNSDDICSISGDISTSVLGGHIAISGCMSMSHLFVDTFFEFAMFENLAFAARIKIMLILQKHYFDNHYQFFGS